MDLNQEPNQEFFTIVEQIPLGSNEVKFQNVKYILSKELLQDGKIIKIFADELGGNDFISFNMYKIKSGWSLKPCEMPAEKVVNFIDGFEII